MADYYFEPGAHVWRVGALSSRSLYRQMDVVAEKYGYNGAKFVLVGREAGQAEVRGFRSSGALKASSSGPGILKALEQGLVFFRQRPKVKI